MSDKSAIEWTEATWNPVTGCTKVSPGCAWCYITRTPPFRIAGRAWHREGNTETTGVILHPERLGQPLKWRAPRRIFVNSLSDLFHEDVPDDFLDRMFAVMALTPQHTFQVLTKRPERMREYLTALDRRDLINAVDMTMLSPVHMRAAKRFDDWADAQGTVTYVHTTDVWPLPNVWLGVTAENQHWADERIPILLDTPAAVRFVSCEPLLGAIDLTPYMERVDNSLIYARPPECRLDWVIAGGESAGPEYRSLLEVCDTHARGNPPWYACPDCTGVSATHRVKPSALAAVRSLRDQCVAAGVPFFFKQWGGKTAKSGGRMLDGRTWSEYPV